MASEDAKQARKAAMTGVRQHFVPVLQTAGFAGKGSTYRRFRDDRVDLVEIQTSKSGGALCVNLAQYPPEGLDVLGKSVGPAEVTLVHVNTVRGRFVARLGAHTHAREDAWFRYASGGSPSADIPVAPDDLGRTLAEVWSAEAEPAFERGLLAWNEETRERAHKERIAAQYRRRP